MTASALVGAAHPRATGFRFLQGKSGSVCAGMHRIPVGGGSLAVRLQSRPLPYNPAEHVERADRRASPHGFRSALPAIHEDRHNQQNRIRRSGFESSQAHSRRKSARSAPMTTFDGSLAVGVREPRARISPAAATACMERVLRRSGLEAVRFGLRRLGRNRSARGRTTRPRPEVAGS
jgi:hypothetical protein